MEMAREFDIFCPLEPGAFRLFCSSLIAFSALLQQSVIQLLKLLSVCYLFAKFFQLFLG
jgi:hypothetical protein